VFEADAVKNRIRTMQVNRVKNKGSDKPLETVKK